MPRGWLCAAYSLTPHDVHHRLPLVSLRRDPDARRLEVWQRAAAAQAGWLAWAQWLGLDVLLLLAPALPAGEQLALHSRWVAQAGKCDLSEIEDMKIV